MTSTAVPRRENGTWSQAAFYTIYLWRSPRHREATSIRCFETRILLHSMGLQRRSFPSTFLSHRVASTRRQEMSRKTLASQKGTMTNGPHKPPRLDTIMRSGSTLKAFDSGEYSLQLRARRRRIKVIRPILYENTDARGPPFFRCAEVTRNICCREVGCRSEPSRTGAYLPRTKTLAPAKDVLLSRLVPCVDSKTLLPRILLIYQTCGFTTLSINFIVLRSILNDVTQTSNAAHAQSQRTGTNLQIEASDDFGFSTQISRRLTASFVLQIRNFQHLSVTLHWLWLTFTQKQVERQDHLTA
jgi:hypothetical protein